MAEIRLAKREQMNRAGLLTMLQTIFSDEDTNGNNGVDFLRLSTSLSKCDDDIMYEKYSDENIDEATVVKEYAEWYMASMNSFCDRWQDYSCSYDKDGYIVAVAYAYY